MRQPPPANTPIEVSAQLANDQLALNVADRDRASRPNGCRASLTNFPRTYRARRRQRTRLTIVKGFVEAHAGTITANQPARAAV